MNCSRKVRQFWICFLFDKSMLILKSFTPEALLNSNKSCDTDMPPCSKFALSWFCGIVFGHYWSLWVSFLKKIVSNSKFLEVICCENCTWLEKKKIWKVVNVWKTVTGFNKWGRQDVVLAQPTINIREKFVFGQKVFDFDKSGSMEYIVSDFT